jgi:hypothetical protein
LSAHRHGPGPEHDFEPVLGLPEALPQGERMLWQGSPDWKALARRAFHLRKLAVYFGAIVAVNLASKLAQDAGAGEIVFSTAWTALLATAGLGLVGLLAWLSARTTVYTITDRRLVMRIGIVLTMTFNVPFRSIRSAGVALYPDGVGDVPIALGADDKIAYAHLWPHARPWRVAHPEPMLRCVPDAARVSRILADAWSAATGGATARPVAAPQAARPDRHDDGRADGQHPALAVR